MNTDFVLDATTREKVADPHLADKLHQATSTSLAKTQKIIGEISNWQDLRHHARKVKLHTLTHLDRYLRQFVAEAERQGAVVTWADTGEDACRQVLDVAKLHKVRLVAKAKSMTSEEIELNRAFEAAGIEPIETDFGEIICQLAGELPSHVTAPIIHWSMREVAELFMKRGIIESLPPILEMDAPSMAERLAAAADLTAAARSWLREKFLSADMGTSGANFLVAESGSLVLVENEANIRLSTSLPKLHVAVVGIEKLIPRLADLGTFLSMLPVAATGQRQSSYVSLIHRPYAGLHIVLLDNGRSRLLADPQHLDLLSCIRCGACMNACPVYRHISGHGYHSVYPGPIGAVLMPHLREEPAFRQLPFASSLCGACSEICPVRIPLADRLLQWRDRIVACKAPADERTKRPWLERVIFSGWGWWMRHPKLYRGLRPPPALVPKAARRVDMGRRWLTHRDLPDMAKQSFAEWWKENRDSRQD